MRNTKNILSEGDMQSWVFTYLQVDLREDSGLLLDNRIGIDCNLSYLSAPLRLRGKLNKYPDVIILDTDEYDTHESCDLYDRKGFTAWGSAIMLELKLLRTSNNINNQKKLWEKDIDKLDLIRDY